MSWWFGKEYESVAQKRRKAEKLIEKLRKKHPDIKPVCIEGRALAKSVWGKAWCKHMDGMADYENRLPRGRSYARNSAVCHLDIRQGEVEAWISGTHMYTVTMRFQPLPRQQWTLISKACAGKISTLLEILQGKLSKEVMAVVCHPENGIFPKTREISYSCSCPDSARLCKHVAAAFYGIGSRLDDEPELLFQLRGVDPAELFSLNAAAPSDTGAADSLQGTDLAGLFGIDLVEAPASSLSKAPEKEAPIPPVPGMAEKKAASSTGSRRAQPAVKAADPPAVKEIDPPAVKQARVKKKAPPLPLAPVLPALDFAALTGKDVAVFREATGLSLYRFSARLDVCQSTVRRWEDEPGILKLHPSSLKKLRMLYTKLCRKR